VLAHGAAQLCRQGEDDVEVRHGQEQVVLALEPAPGGAVAAAGAGPVMARVRQPCSLPHAAPKPVVA
jgi:hypothetical protein